MRNIIPNNITIFEQFQRRDQFMDMVAKWQRSLPGYALPVRGCNRKIKIEQLLKDSGVKCHYANTGILAGFKLVDEKAYAWFVLRWS